MSRWFWIVLGISSWAALWLLTDRRRFKDFWTGGLWSVGLAVLTESLIRWPNDYFVSQRLLVPFLGADLTSFLGPRFVEGVLFMQSMRPRRQFVRCAGWVAMVVLAELGLVLGGYVALDVGIALGLAAAVHTLRFLSLLGLFHALGYSLLSRRLMYQQARRVLGRFLLGMSRYLWPVSWPVFALGAAVFLKVTRSLSSGAAR